MSFEKKIGYGFALVIAVLILLGWYTFENNRDYARTSKMVTHTNEVLFNIERLLSQAIDIETGQRGFELTADERFLLPYFNSVNELPKILTQLKTLTADNATQQHKLDTLSQLVDEKMKIADDRIFAKRAGQAMGDAGTRERGRIVMNQIRAIVASMQIEERKLMELRLVASEKKMNEFKSAFGALFLTIIILLSLTLLSIRINQRARSQAELALRRTSLEFENLYNHAPCGYYSTDPSMVIININQTLLDWLGCAKEEVMGKKFSVLLSSESLHVFQSGLNERFQQYQAKGFVSDIEYEFLRKDNTTFPVILSSAMVRDDQHNFSHSLSTAFDMSDRKVTEERIKQLNNTLAANNQKLDASNKELDAFTFSVSHDLRTPLRSISGYAAILQEDYGPALDEDGRSILTRVISNSKRMGQLIDDLLDFSRLGKLQPSKALLDMETMARNSVDEQLNGSSRHPDIQILPLVRSFGDPNLMRHVWSNLISNAIKYSSKKERAEIKIGSQESDDSVTYYVKDNGTGFDMTYSHKLFGVFQRLHTPEDFEGTGVGLAIVNRIITRHGGSVWAESKPNQGAIFYFSLPRS